MKGAEGEFSWPDMADVHIPQCSGHAGSFCSNVGNVLLFMMWSCYRALGYCYDFLTEIDRRETPNGDTPYCRQFEYHKTYWLCELSKLQGSLCLSLELSKSFLDLTPEPISFCVIG